MADTRDLLRAGGALECGDVTDTAVSPDPSPEVAAASPRPRKLRWNVGRPLLEVVLISLGVFLGLAAEQWRDRSERQQRATETLRRMEVIVAYQIE